MKPKTKKRLMWLVYIIATILLLLISIQVYTKQAPQFGAQLTSELQDKYSSSPNFKDGVFWNLEETNMDMGFKTGLGVARDFLFGDSVRKPSHQIPMAQPNFEENNTDTFKITWFGHSTILVQVSGKNILIDPMLGKTPSPVGFIGSDRFWDSLPTQISHLPKIDVVIISHDHYDHLDYETCKKISNKVGVFYMPLAVGRHLERWGVDSDKIHELDWWDEVQFESLKFILAPSRHFSGRGPTDKNTTLWGSWILESKSQKIYFSGDGGYGSHFKTIGEKYGPFDFAMIECGQYDKRWQLIHMLPEESVMAAQDINTKVAMPIHWGAFTLAVHSWTDPVERFINKSEELNQDYLIPQIGQSFFIAEKIKSNWYKQ